MKKIMLIITSFLTITLIQGQIRLVPSQYPTIQAGITAANPGDTVLVAEGTYYEQVSLSGHMPVLVGSQFIMDGNQNHISATIIDGSHLPQSENMSVVIFGTGNDSTTILCGFTVRGGKGKHYSDSYGDCLDGGGIFISGGGAKICHNIVTENTLDDGIYSGTQYFAGGAGIYTDFETTSYWTVISNNIITHNTVTGQHQFATGGGICLFNNARIISNTIKDNSCIITANATETDGGGIFAQSSGTPKEIVFQGNVIDSNIIQVSCGKIGHGGGVDFLDLKANITNNQITNNKGVVLDPPGRIIGAGMRFIIVSDGSIIKGNLFQGNEGARNQTSSYLGSLGGALRMGNEITDNRQLEISNNRFIRNKADEGGAIESYGIHLTLFNNLFLQNEASVLSGAVIFDWDYPSGTEHHVYLANNTFYKNHAPCAGAIWSYCANPFILNTIFCRDSSETGSNEFYVCQDGGNLEVAFSDLDTIPTGNISWGNVILNSDLLFDDPLFSDLSTLQTDHWSPCVEAGTPAYYCSHGEYYEAPSFDILGNNRPVGRWYDMGAYDIQGWGVGVKKISNYELRVSIYPDPFLYSTTFSYDLKESCKVNLEIFDSFGRKVAEPVKENQLKGKHKIIWDTSAVLPGIYLYRLSDGKTSASGKIAKK
jgi:hypothetical protein